MSGDKEKAAKRPNTEMAMSPEKEGEMDMGTVSAMKRLLHELLQGYGLDTLSQSLKDLTETVELAHRKGEEAKTLAKENEIEIKKLKSELDECKQYIKQEHEARLKNECYERRSNLKFVGIPELDGEKDGDCERLVLETINSKMLMNSDNISVERCHRLGPKSRGSRPRPIIIRFTLYKDRQRVWGSRRLLAGTNIFVREDFAPEIEKRRASLIPIYREALKDKSLGKVALVNDTLYINTEKYTVDTLHRVPTHLKPEHTATRSNEAAVWFWRKESPFSNHHACKFQEGDTVYNCTEQYLMVHKAQLFGDTDAAERIMKMKNPIDQKRAQVKHFNSDHWRQHAPDIMKRALTLKFEQNEDLKKVLIETGTKVIGEAAPHDDFWGCGFSMNDPDIANPDKWNGQNTLGQCLMNVRMKMKMSH